MPSPALRAVCALLIGYCCAGTHSAQAAILQSANFSFGYGYFSPTNNPLGNWNTSETFAANTPTVQGDFTFSPVVSGGQFASEGPGFPNRTLTDSASNGWLGVSIAYPTQAGFLAAVTGSFTGDIPGSNPQVRINIDQISIWGISFAGFSTGGVDNLAFSETTLGHTSASPPVALNHVNSPVANLQLAGNFTQLLWNPNDFIEIGTSSSRSFELLSGNLYGIDGFEIQGTIDLIYTPAPEPSTLALLGLGIVGMAIKRRRSRG